MKNILIIFFSLCLFYSCSEESERGQYPLDSVPPKTVSAVSVENQPGGAIISYTIPDDEDLLYVKAIYKLDDGTVMEQKASAYSNQIKIEGLGISQSQTIQLISGDRSKNESEAVNVEIFPLESPIYDVLNTVSMVSDFGGVLVSWANPLRSNIVVTVSALGEDGKFTEVQNVYTKATQGKVNVRGYLPEETVFAVSVRDKWMNRTDTISEALTPLFEEKLDRTKFVRWNPSGIPYMELAGWGWTIEKLWDGQLSYASAGGYSFPTTAVLPASFTMDIGQTACLGRIKIYPRATGAQLYTGGNVKKFQVWGSPHPNVNADFSNWVFLGDFEDVKPSGSAAGVVTQEDIDFATAGVDYSVENSATPVRYLRFYIEKTWGGGAGMQIFEVEFYGSITK